MKRKKTFAVLTIAVLSALATLAPAAGAAPKPAWKLTVSSNPTNFVPGSTPGFAEGPQYSIVATNVGGAPTSGQITVTDALPAGLMPSGPKVFFIDGGSCEISGQQVTCTANGSLVPGKFMFVAIPLDVGAFPDPTVLDNSVTISGGGAVSTTASTSTVASFESAEFDFVSGEAGLSAWVNEADGIPTSQAGSHPHQLTIDITPSTVGAGAGAVVGADGGVRDVGVSLPRGLIVNPTATPVRCTEAQLEQGYYGGGGCPNASQVGAITIDTVAPTILPTQSPVFNMVPPPGVAAQFGFDAIVYGIFTHIDGGVRPGDYALSSDVNDVLALGLNPLLSSQVQLWGDPSSPTHDEDRGACSLPGGTGSCPVTPQNTPLLSMPSACRDSLSLDAEIASWGHPNDFKAGSVAFTDINGNTTPVDGCEQLDFNPTLEARPTTNSADSPSGLSVDLHIPQTNSLSQLSTAHLRKAVVALPQGLALNPSSANGLEGCSSAQIGIDPSTGVADGNQPTCPNASRIGEVEVDTPLLPNALPGSVYVATPRDNPFDSLLAIYISVNDPQTGTLIKLAGHVEADPNTGQLTTTFDENPQLPFTDFKLSFFGGPGAVLRTPAVCGTFSTTSSMTPWSAPESGPPATPHDDYAITGNCSSSAASQPNKPQFEAGTVSPIAGKYTPFVVHLKREDGSQQFKTLTLNPPPGLTAKLAGTPACSDGALAAAAAKSGKSEQASPSCPADTQIGTVSVGAGAGPAPYYAKGTAYLTGPYKGAPLGMAIITPAVAGPYDLGTVVTRVALHVDPATAQITADADPIPSILQGIPLDVRSVDVSLDKPGFSKTGTSCDPMAVGGSLISTLGQSVGLESRYQLGNCANLAFKPKLAIRLKGGTKRTQNPALIATLTAKEGEANIASTAVTLPRSAFLDQSHIKTVCTRVQFAAGGGNGEQCPPGSIYGTASAKSPLLDYTLTGNAYLRSSSHKLPDLVIALHGPPSQPIAIELDGITDSVKGALRNTFEAVPDAPVSSFRLELFGGKRGLVVNSRNLCAKDYRADVQMSAHSGKTASLQPVVQSSCKKSAHKKKHKRHG